MPFDQRASDRGAVAALRRVHCGANREGPVHHRVRPRGKKMTPPTAGGGTRKGEPLMVRASGHLFPFIFQQH